EDRPLRGEILEHLAGEDAASPAAGLGDQQEQRVGAALEPERLAMRRERMQLEPIAEAERLGPLAVAGAEVADEARRHVQAGGGERLQERPRAALAEEAAGVRDREPLAASVLEPGEVVEVAAVRDRRDLCVGLEPAGFLGD